MAREERKGRGWGGARLGAALRNGGGAAQLGVFCGHRRGTFRREIFDGTSETQTDLIGDEIARFGGRALGRGVNSRRGIRFFAKNFIGRALRRSGSRVVARRRFRCAVQRARQLCGLISEFARWIHHVCSHGVAIRREVSFDEPTRQQSIAALIYPDLKKLRDLLSYVCGEIQTRLLVRLQSRFRRTEKKFPIHFLLRTLVHGDPPNGWSTLPFY